MSECPHSRIEAWLAENPSDAMQPLVAMWSCANPDCRIRFYPACRNCVDVGHRNDCDRKSPEPESPETSRLGGSR